MRPSVVPTPEAILFEGVAGAGKTQRLVQRAGSLVESGADPLGVLVLCASPQTADAFEQRAVAAGAAGVRCTTPREWALGLLSHPDARAFIGRRARLLLPFEEDLLFEDLRTIGMKQRRAVEMLRFMKRNFSEAAEDGDWLISTEEETFLGVLRSSLEASDALLECEVTAFALRWVVASRDVAPAAEAAIPEAAVQGVREDAATGPARARSIGFPTEVPHVLVDDYQNMSRASQLLANAIAGESIAVALDPAASLEVFDSFPYARGREEFLQANPGACLERLEGPAASRTAARVMRLLASCSDDGRRAETVPEAPDDGGASFEEQVFESPEREVFGVAAIVKEALGRGIDAQDICVAYADKRWGRELTRVLPRVGIGTAVLERGDMLRGDVRDARRSVGARALSLLALAVDLSDGLAWRSVCGLGDTLTRSYGFSLLRDYAREHGLSMSAALQAAYSGDLPDPLPSACAEIARLADRTAQVLTACRNLSGEDLLYAIACMAAGPEEVADVSRELCRLVRPVASGDDAATLLGHALARCSAPRFSDPRGVRVLAANDCAGLSPRVLVLSGMVNGFVPPRVYFDKSALVEADERALWRAGAQRMYAAVANVRDRIVVTRFSHIEPEGAERFELEVERVRFERGKRMCVAAESAYLSQLRPRDGAES